MAIGKIRRGVLAALGAALLLGCSSTGGPFGLSPEQQLALGEQEHPKIVAAFGGEIDDPAIRAYVDGIVRRLLASSDQPQAPIKTTVLDSPVINAMALPGHVYVTRGLMALANSEAELAGVIGHEIGHIFEQHTAERYSRSNVAGIGSVLAGIGTAILTGDGQLAQQAQQLAGTGAQLYLLRFSREQEYEADLVGVRMMAAAGYDPIGEARFLNSLGRWSELEAQISGQNNRPPEFLSSHPNTAERVQRAAQEANVLGTGAGEIGRDKYLTRIDGLLYGSDPIKEGFVRGNAFYHPTLNIGFAVPSGMKLVNTSQAVVAQSQNAQMQFTGASSQNGPGALVQQLGQQLQVQLSQPQGFRSNGKQGAFASGRANTQGGQVDVQVYAIQWSGPSHYVFLWVTPVNATASLQQGIQQSVGSLRSIAGSGIQPPPTLRVDVVTIQRGDSVSSLAAMTGFENAKPERFVVFNGLENANSLQAGQRAKLVR